MGKLAFASVFLLTGIFASALSAGPLNNGTEVGNGMTAGAALDPLSLMDDVESEAGLTWSCFSRYDVKARLAESYAGEALASRDQAIDSAMHACEDANGGVVEDCAFDGCTFTSEH